MEKKDLTKKFDRKNDFLRMLLWKSVGSDELVEKAKYLRFNFNFPDSEVRNPFEKEVEIAMNTNKQMGFLGLYFCLYEGDNSLIGDTKRFHEKAKYLRYGNAYLDFENNLGYIINQPVMVFLPKIEEIDIYPEHYRYISLKEENFNQCVSLFNKNNIKSKQESLSSLNVLEELEFMNKERELLQI